MNGVDLIGKKKPQSLSREVGIILLVYYYHGDFGRSYGDFID